MTLLDTNPTPNDSGLGLPEGSVGSVDTVTPTVPPEGADGTLPEFKTIVPPEYADKTWVSEVKDIPSLFKMVDDTKALVGKRPAGIPQDNAPEEEWKAFDQLRGVPETPDVYDFKIEGKEFNETDKAFHDALRPVLLDAGITPRQLAKLAPPIKPQ